jgi:hypothetical protein
MKNKKLDEATMVYLKDLFVQHVSAAADDPMDFTKEDIGTMETVGKSLGINIWSMPMTDFERERLKQKFISEPNENISVCPTCFRPKLKLQRFVEPKVIYCKCKECTNWDHRSTTKDGFCVKCGKVKGKNK